MTPDSSAIRKWIDRTGKLVYTAPQNAIWIGPHHFTPEKNGKQLNRQLLMEQMLGYVLQTGPQTIQAGTKEVYPMVNTELLMEITHKKISHYATYFNVRNESRAHNIRLAAAAINSAVVFPGDTFSFNDIVGIRTTQKGYRNAAIIVRGELSEGIGGGICQVSSTLFNAVDQGGLKVVSRYSHSRNVPYVLPGRDATVSWNGPDFAFRNEYNQPVIIRATVARGALYISLYSSETIRFTPKSVPQVSRELPEEQPNSEVWDTDG
ncbi:MAG: VanW family protein [Gorillibacterium sp.]|nr:VanW family protein [Gorillibacterium sp.]